MSMIFHMLIESMSSVVLRNGKVALSGLSVKSPRYIIPGHAATSEGWRHSVKSLHTVHRFIASAVVGESIDSTKG